MTDAIRELIEANKWRPIEEAPKDGRWFMAYQHSEYDVVGEYTGWVGTVRYELKNDQFPELMKSNGEFEREVYTAKHFRPLPDDRLARVCEVLLAALGDLSTVHSLGLEWHHIKETIDVTCEEAFSKATAIAKREE